MEIRNGYGTSGTRVAGNFKDYEIVVEKSIQTKLFHTGPVRVGDPLTLIIYMRSKYGRNNFKIH